MPDSFVASHLQGTTSRGAKQEKITWPVCFKPISYCLLSLITFVGSNLQRKLRSQARGRHVICMLFPWCNSLYPELADIVQGKDVWLPTSWAAFTGAGEANTANQLYSVRLKTITSIIIIIMTILTFHLRAQRFESMIKEREEQKPSIPPKKKSIAELPWGCPSPHIH